MQNNYYGDYPSHTFLTFGSPVATFENITSILNTPNHEVFNILEVSDEDRDISNHKSLTDRMRSIAKCIFCLHCCQCFVKPEVESEPLIY